MIENFGIPASIRKEKGISKMGRVFRDQEELPLSSDLGNDIHVALEHSEWLIVICSPRLLQSRWCLEEIQYFISLGKQDHILTVLVEGEPSESFPEVLCYREIDGVRIPKEPLAADVRSDTIEGSLKILKTEKLRILAPMLDVRFDDLRQRARARRRRIIAGFVSVAFILLTGFLTYALIKNGQLDKERKTALDNQMKLLIEEANTEVSNGNKRVATSYLVKAKELRDQVGQGNDDLFLKSLEYTIYSGSFEPVLNITSNNRHFGSFVFSNDDKMLLAVTNVNSVCLIDAQTGDILYTVSRANSGMVDEAGFSSDDAYFYMVDSWYGFVSVYKTKDGTLYRELDMSDGRAWNIAEKAFALQDHRLLVVKPDKLILWNYDTDTTEEILPVSGDMLDSYTQGLIVELSHDRNTIAIGSHGGGYGGVLYQMDTKETTQLEIDPLRGYSNLAFSRDGRYLGATSGTKYIIWNTKTGKSEILEDFDEEASTCDNIVLSASGTYALICSADRVVLKDIFKKSTLWTMEAQSYTLISGVFSADEKYLSLTGGIEGIYDTQTGGKISEIGGAVFSHDGGSLLAGSYEDQPFLLSTPESATVYRTEKFEGKIFQTERFTEPNLYVPLISSHVTGSFYTEGAGSVGRSAMAFTDPDAEYLAYCHEDGFIEVFDLEKGRNAEDGLIASYAMAEHCYNAISDVVFHDRLMASCGGYDPRCVLFDLNSGSIRYVLQASEYCFGAEFSPDGRQIILLSGYSRKQAPVYSTETGNLLFTMTASCPIDVIGFTGDGRQAVAVLEDGTFLIGQMYSGLEEMMNELE